MAAMLSWVDDILALGHLEDVKQIKSDLQSAFVSKSEGKMKEYVGNKVDVVRQSDGKGKDQDYTVVSIQSFGMSSNCLMEGHQRLLQYLVRCWLRGMAVMLSIHRMQQNITLE
jgi:hypothetical protein